MSDTPAAPPVPDRARLAQRGLFSYTNGVVATPIIADQFVIQGRLADACPGKDIAALDTLLADVGGESPEAKATSAPAAADDAPSTPDAARPILSAQTRMVRAGLALDPIITAGFLLPPLDPTTGQGYSLTEKLALLSDFFESLGGDGLGESESENENESDHADPAAEATHEDHPTGSGAGG